VWRPRAAVLAGRQTGHRLEMLKYVATWTLASKMHSVVAPGPCPTRTAPPRSVTEGELGGRPRKRTHALLVRAVQPPKPPAPRRPASGASELRSVSFRLRAARPVSRSPPPFHSPRSTPRRLPLPDFHYRPIPVAPRATGAGGQKQQRKPTTVPFPFPSPELSALPPP
jgi:hypothetical protein